MKTVSHPLSSTEEARAKIQEALAIFVEMVLRLSSHEQRAVREDVIVAAKQLEEAQTTEQFRLALCYAIENCSVHLMECREISIAGKMFRQWLTDAEKRLARMKKKSPDDWLIFVLKWSRLWKASLLSLLGALDMAVWVGEAIEGAIAKEEQSRQLHRRREALLRCWKHVEQGLVADTFLKLKTLLQRVRRERETIYFLKDHPPSISFSDVGSVERAIGLEEFLLKVMIEAAAKKLQEGGRPSTGIQEFESLQQHIEEHITTIGAEAAEASAMNLVLQTVQAEKQYLMLSLTWGARKQQSPADAKHRLARSTDYHKAHCAVIDAYMELSDCKSMRGVMLCYELPVFTQLLYDQRKRMDEEINEKKQAQLVAPALSMSGCCC